MIEIANLDVVNRVPVPALRGADFIRKLGWRLTDRDLRGAGAFVRDVDTREILIFQQTYGTKDMWYMPGGGLSKADRQAEVLEGDGIGHVVDLARYRKTAEKEFVEETGMSLGQIVDIAYLDTSVNTDGPGSDTYAIFDVGVEGLSDYGDSLRSEGGRYATSKEMRRAWIVQPEWLASSGLLLHHALKKAVSAPIHDLGAVTPDGTRLLA